jgi:DNA-binding MarR family transcriptional regulator
MTRTESAAAPYRELAMPVLLRASRLAYAREIRSRLADAGFDDVPRAGVRVIGQLAQSPDVSVSEMAVGDGVSRQAASKLVEVLSQRDYIARTPDPEDRRRSMVSLTDRGRAASEVVREAIDHVDGGLIATIGAGPLWEARKVLAVMAAMGAGEDISGETLDNY